MLTPSLRAAITAAGGTPTQNDAIGLLRELVTALGGTPTQFSIIGLLREAIIAKGGTPTAFSTTALLQQLVTALGATPSTFDTESLAAQVAASAAPPVVSFDSGLINNGGMDDASGWTLTGPDPVIAGGVFSSTTGGGATRNVDNATLVSGSWYQLAGTAPTNGGSINFTLGGKVGLKVLGGSGAFTVYLQAGSVDNGFAVSLSGGTSIDNLVLSGPKTVTLGSSIIANGGFDDASSWTLGGGNTTISGGTLNMAAEATNQRATNTPVSAPVVGTYYQATFTISGRTAGSIAVGGPFSGATTLSNGTATQYGYATATASPYITTKSSNTTLSVDNFSIQPMTFS